MPEINIEEGTIRLYQGYIAMGDYRLPFAAMVTEILNSETENKGMIQIARLSQF